MPAGSTHAIALAENCVQTEDGSKVAITFRNKTRRVFYFTVFDLMPLKQIQKLYPPHKDYQTVLFRDSSNVLPKTVLGIVKPPGRVPISTPLTIPKRIRDLGGDQADDILKIFISTSPMRGASSFELPDMWTQSDTTSPSDTIFGSFIQESFADREGQLSFLRGEDAPIK